MALARQLSSVEAALQGGQRKSPVDTSRSGGGVGWGGVGRGGLDGGRGSCPSFQRRVPVARPSILCSRPRPRLVQVPEKEPVSPQSQWAALRQLPSHLGQTALQPAKGGTQKRCRGASNVALQVQAQADKMAGPGLRAGLVSPGERPSEDRKEGEAASASSQSKSGDGP